MRQNLFTLGLTIIVMGLIKLIEFIMSLGILGDALVLSIVFCISYITIDGYLSDVDKEIFNNKNNESKN